MNKEREMKKATINSTNADLGLVTVANSNRESTEAKVF